MHRAARQRLQRCEQLLRRCDSDRKVVLNGRGLDLRAPFLDAPRSLVWGARGHAVQRRGGLDVCRHVGTGGMQTHEGITNTDQIAPSVALWRGPEQSPVAAFIVLGNIKSILLWSLHSLQSQSPPCVHSVQRHTMTPPGRNWSTSRPWHPSATPSDPATLPFLTSPLHHPLTS